MWLQPQRTNTKLLVASAAFVPVLAAVAFSLFHSASSRLGERLGFGILFVVAMMHIQLLNLQKNRFGDPADPKLDSRESPARTPRWLQVFLGDSWPSKISLILGVALYTAAVSAGWGLLVGLPGNWRTSPMGEVGCALLAIALPTGVFGGIVAGPYVRFILVKAGFHGPGTAELRDAVTASS